MSTLTTATSATLGSSPIDSITAKLDAMALDNTKRPKVIMKLEDGGDNIGFYIDTETLIANIGPSKAGTSNGVVIAVNGDFSYEKGGKRYTFNLALQGGWAGVKVTSITDVVPVKVKHDIAKQVIAEAAKA